MTSSLAEMQELSRVTCIYDVNCGASWLIQAVFSHNEEFAFTWHKHDSLLEIFVSSIKIKPIKMVWGH